MKISGFKFKRPRLRFLRRVDDRVKLDSGRRSGDLIKILISIALWIVIVVFAVRIFNKGLPKIPSNLIDWTDWTDRTGIMDRTPAASPVTMTSTPTPQPSPQPSPITALSTPSPSPKTSSQGPSKVTRSCIVCANASPSPSPSPE